MKIFSTIREFVDYVPNCIICNKTMNIVLDVSILNYRPLLKTKFVKVGIIDNMLVSKNKNYPFAINIDDNYITNGKEFFSKKNKYIFIEKYCSTCLFKIKTVCVDVKDFSYYPIVYLGKESLFYTKKGNKPIKIEIYYYEYSNYLVINGKSTDFSLNLNKFSNLNHLNRRINTLLTFQ